VLRKLLAVDVGDCYCAVAIEFHAVGCYVFLFFSEEFGVVRGVEKKEGGKDAENDGDALSTK
jgi:hypothetical protein